MGRFVLSFYPTMATRKEHYGLEGTKLKIDTYVWDLGMCFDKRPKDDWDIHVCSTCCKVPIYYLAGCCCSCCVACYHREHLLYGKMYEDYRCCQGAYGKFWCPTIAKKIPHCCLLAESICCTGCAIAGNRVIMKERYLVKERITETILLILGAILSFLGFFGAIIAAITNGCLNSQEERQLIVEEGASGLSLYPIWEPDNKLWDLQKCEPCCGEPCNFMDGLKCALCWILPCCSLCTLVKFFASTLDQECLLLNHCGPYIVAILIGIFCGWIPGTGSLPTWYLRTAVRHNARVRNKTGDPIHYFGDCLVGNFPIIGCCALCQELRSMPKDSWDWVAQMQEKGFPQVSGEEFTIFRDDGAQPKEN